jgi:SpoVK/Ycf46/Vps4 family AAA+-type ATPase
MSHVSRSGQRILTAVAALAFLSVPVQLLSQAVHPLAQRLVNQAIAAEENTFLLQMERITPEAYKQRLAALTAEARDIAVQLGGLPPDAQTLIRTQANSLLQVRIVPLREQWKQQLADKQKADQARDAGRRMELTADAETAGKLQAARTLIRERLQRNEISQAEAARADQAAEQQVLALQRKYDSYGVSSRTNWGLLFSQTVARVASTVVADTRVRLRLDDTQSEIGRDAHRAAELTLAMQRTQLFLGRQAIAPQDAQALNAAAQTELAAIQAKYGAAQPSAADFKDRVTRLVQTGAAEQRAAWEKEALAAREATAARVAAEREAAANAAKAAAADAAAAEAAAAEAAAARARENARTEAAPPPDSRVRPQPGPRPLPPPVPPPTEPLVLRNSGGSSWRPVILLLLLGGGAAGYVAYRGRRRGAPARFSDVKERYAPAPAAPTSARVTASSTPPPALQLAPNATVKERLLAEQRQKYQMRYSEAVDAVTQTSMALSEMAPVLQAVHENVQKLSKSLQAQVAARVTARTGSTRSLLIRAALLVPVFTLFRRLGLLLKLVLVVFVLWLVGQAMDLVTAGEIPTVLVSYLLTVGVLFVVERYLRLKVPLSALKKHASDFKDLKLAYLYTDQIPHLSSEGHAQLHAIRVRAVEKNATADEITVPTGGNITVAQGAFVMGIGNLGTFEIDPSGSVRLMSAGSNDFMKEHGDLVTEALGEQGSFAAATLPALADYGQALWQRKQAQDDVPRLEALVKDVDRLQKVWQDTCVSDQVFEFLFRRIDMFNMRDSATPAGILLFGSPGNGKAHLAKKIAESISAKFQQINPSKLTTADDITALWEKSRSGEARVLYIANADTAFPQGGHNDASREALEFIAEWEKHEPSESRVWVVMTAQSDQNVHKEVVRQIGKNSKIEITSPDAAGRTMILRQACRAHQVTSPVPEFVVSSTGGASVSDLYEIVEAVRQESTPYQPEEKHWKAAVKAVRGADARIKDERKTWERLVLPDTIKDQLKAACKILQNAPEYLKRGVEVPNILLYGPAGTGKTEIARTIANEGGVNFVETNLATFKADHIGGSGQAVRAKFAEARAMAPAVLFIDEIDGITSQRGSEGEDKFTKEIVTQILSEMDGAARPDRPVVVLGATNHLDHIDRAVLSRFGNKIQIPPPDEQGRKEILKRILRERPLDPAADLERVAAAIAKKTPGMSGRDLLMLAKKAASQAALTADAEHVVITEALLMEIAADAVKDASDAVDDGAKWDSLVVSDQTMAKLKQITTALRNMEARIKQGIDPPRGAILFGPPGTGKTQIARTLANESGVQFFAKTPSDLTSSYQAGAGKNVRMAFDEAKTKAPCILFLDEFESIASVRGKSTMNDEMVTELLVQMEGVKKSGKPVFVLAATNHLEQIDGAVLSRLNDKIEVPLPTAEQRERLFNVFLSKYPRVDFDRREMAAELARRSGDIGGRDIRNLVINASQEAASRAEVQGTPDQIVLGREDLLKQFAPKGEQLTEDEIQKVWSEIVLKPDVKASLLGMIRMFNRGDKAAAKGLLLYGPPGTGKTEIGRTIAKSTGCKFLEVKPSDLKGGYVGQSGKQVKALWDKARSFGRCVMFIDECDGVFARRGGTETDAFADEVVTNFLPEWDGAGSSGQIWVVGATNRRDRFDDAIISRFGTPIEIGLPDAAQRVEILRLEMKKLERNVTVPDFVGPATTGFAGRKLAELAKTVCTLGEKRGSVNDEVWREVIGDSAKATSSAVDESATWDSLILQEPTIRRLKSICSMVKNAEMLRAQHIDVPRAALLFGPPGTGKTQIARTLANESGLAFIAASPSDVKAGYLGQSGQKVRELFERARGSAPCILFIDEIESGAASRDGGKADQYTGEIVNELLTQMDGAKKKTGDVFVLAATNHPKLVDGAVLSRFEERIEIPNPGLEERRRMIKTFIGKRRVDFDVDTAAEELATLSDGLSGRDLGSLVRKASQQAAQRAMDAGTPDQVIITRGDLLLQMSASGR